MNRAERNRRALEIRQAALGPDHTNVATSHNNLASVLHELLPAEPEVAGLFALMRLHHARRDARVDRLSRKAATRFLAEYLDAS